MNRILFAVTNDLSQDQRMWRICTALQNAGYEVCIVGRKRRNSLPLKTQDYQQYRLPCIFQKGKLFYLEYNIRLLWFAIRHKSQVYGAIDLDTILPFLLASKWNKAKLVYDAHEYFTEMEELMHRPATKAVWKFVERLCVPHVHAAYTVSRGYKALFEKEYPITFEIVRNATVLKPYEKVQHEGYVLYQGAVNYGRGLFQLLEALQIFEFPLVICGEGDALEALKKKADNLGVSHLVTFKGFVPPEELRYFTQRAFIGLTIFENTGLSHIHSLANRFFDYFHHGVPQVAMSYPEYMHFQEQFEVALLIKNLNPQTIANSIKMLYNDEKLYTRLQENALKVRLLYHWENEAKTLVQVYRNLLKG